MSILEEGFTTEAELRAEIEHLKDEIETIKGEARSRESYLLDIIRQQQRDLKHFSNACNDVSRMTNKMLEDYDQIFYGPKRTEMHKKHLNSLTMY